MAYYLIRGGGGRFVLTTHRPQMGVTLVTFPPLPAKEGQFQVRNGWLAPVLDPRKVPVEVRAVPRALGGQLAAMKKRHEDLLASANDAYLAYLRMCVDVYPTLPHVRFPPPEDPS